MIRRLRPADYRRMPWRNGGGTTTEIAVSPDDVSPDRGRFLWRLSVADVTADGPFSRFEGYDRHIMLLEGGGMTLACGVHGTIDLRPFVARSFSGDWQVHGALAAGPVRDLNLIVDRARAVGVLGAHVISSPGAITVDPAELSLVYVIDGDAGIATAGDTLVLGETCTLEPRGEARVAIARIRPR